MHIQRIERKDTYNMKYNIWATNIAATNGGKRENRKWRCEKRE